MKISDLDRELEKLMMRRLLEQRRGVIGGILVERRNGIQCMIINGSAGDLHISNWSVISQKVDNQELIGIAVNTEHQPSRPVAVRIQVETATKTD
jgi:hypothetical protein